MKTTAKHLFFFIICLIIPFSSCQKKKPVDLHGQLTGTTADISDSVIFVILHPNTVLDTIRIINKQFAYNYPNNNFRNVKMTHRDSIFQKGWCKNSDFYAIKLELLKTNGNRYSVMFLNKYENQYYDLMILDNCSIKLTITNEELFKNNLKAVVSGSIETDKLMKRSFDFFKRKNQ